MAGICCRRQPNGNNFWGVQQRPWGKWACEIRDRSRRTRVLLVTVYFCKLLTPFFGLIFLIVSLLPLLLILLCDLEDCSIPLRLNLFYTDYGFSSSNVSYYDYVWGLVVDVACRIHCEVMNWGGRESISIGTKWRCSCRGPWWNFYCLMLLSVAPLFLLSSHCSSFWRWN